MIQKTVVHQGAIQGVLRDILQCVLRGVLWWCPLGLSSRGVLQSVLWGLLRGALLQGIFQGGHCPHLSYFIENFIPFSHHSIIGLNSKEKAMFHIPVVKLFKKIQFLHLYAHNEDHKMKKSN
jgi:hypothetical protein